MKSLSLSAKSLNDLESKINNHQEFLPTLGFCFSSTIFNPIEIVSLFNTANIPMIAASSAGEINNDNFESESISVMLFDLPKAYFNIHFAPYNATDSSYQTCFKVGQFAKSIFENPAIIVVSSQYGIDGQTIINGIQDGAGNDTQIFDGLAADDQDSNTVWVCGNGRYSENGIAVLIIDASKVEVSGLATSGWEPIGVKHTITAASGNQVNEINNQPALDVFANYFGFREELNNDAKTESKIISGQYPFQIEKNDSYSILRSPVIADVKNRALILGGSVETGQSFRFSASPGFEVIEKTVDSFKTFAETEVKEAEALLLFSCTGRYASLGPLIEDELKGIRQNWEVPMVGAFTLGEIGRNKDGVCDFHNITCSLVTLKEI